MQGGPKMRHLRLIAHVFKTHEPICMIFGTLQCCLVLNALLALYYKVALPSDTINNPIFHLGLQNQARPLHSKNINNKKDDFLKHSC